MSIATAITAAQGRVADCYTAISNRGGTLPATEAQRNLSNMPTAINSIPTGGISSLSTGVTYNITGLEDRGVSKIHIETTYGGGDSIYTVDDILWLSIDVD